MSDFIASGSFSYTNQLFIECKRQFYIIESINFGVLPNLNSSSATYNLTSNTKELYLSIELKYIQHTWGNQGNQNQGNQEAEWAPWGLSGETLQRRKASKDWHTLVKRLWIKNMACADIYTYLCCEAYML